MIDTNPIMKKFLAILHARNMEFIRDKSSLGWNILFPLLLVVGFALIFSGEPRAMYKVGVLGDTSDITTPDKAFYGTQYVQFIGVDDLDKAIGKVEHFQLDMLVDVRSGRTYWINKNSPNGYVLERMLWGEGGRNYLKKVVEGREIRYVDWVVPGILAMNMMFSCLFGVAARQQRHLRRAVRLVRFAQRREGCGQCQELDQARRFESGSGSIQ